MLASSSGRALARAVQRVGALMRDGDVDYSRYTLLELEEALAGINRDQYPENYARRRAAHERLTAAKEKGESDGSALRGQTVESESPTSRKGSAAWDRLFAILAGVACFWSAYDLATQPACRDGRKLVALILNAVCERVGHAAAAAIAVLFGLISLAYALREGRED
jgi:hypothetical protein